MSNNTESFAGELAEATIGCRIRFSWFGSEKTVDRDAKQRFADCVGATRDNVKAQKRLIPSDSKEFKALTKLKRSVRDYWEAATLSYTEPGTRLLKRDQVESFAERIEAFKSDLSAAVDNLESVYFELRAQARETLGDLFNPADYPDSMLGAFAIEYDFPELNPPNYLAQLAPDVYARESRRVQASFSEAVQLAETAFASELAKLVDHIRDTLRGVNDGTRKKFNDTTVTNFEKFFDRFDALNIGSNAELDRLVATARDAVSGVAPSELRESRALRADIADTFSDISRQITEAAIVAPKRKLTIGGDTEAAESSAPVDSSPARRAMQLQPVAEAEAQPVSPPSVDIGGVKVSGFAAACFGLASTPKQSTEAEPAATVASSADDTEPQPEPEPEPPVAPVAGRRLILPALA